MKDRRSALANWTPEQIAAAQRWVDTWKLAAPELEAIRRRELRALDAYKAIAMLSGPAYPGSTPAPLAPSSGLVEQQRWFKLAARHH